MHIHNVAQHCKNADTNRIAYTSLKGNMRAHI